MKRDGRPVLPFIPMDGVGLPDFESAKPNPLSIDEQFRVNELEMNLRDLCIWHLEYGHGWRPVSCEGLMADDVLEAVQRADGFILRTQKKRAGKLTTTRAPILPETLSLLEELVNVLQLRGKVAVFWGRRSEPLGEEGLYKVVKRLYERAGVRVRTKENRNGHIPYDLRDTFANTVEEAVGPGGRGVAERLMGHESGKSIELYLVNRQPQELATYSPLRRMVCGKGDGLWNSPSQKQNSPAKKTEENSSLELVETGESRTPRPKDPLAEYTTSLSGALFFTSESFHRPNIPEISRQLFGSPYRSIGHRIPDLWRLHLRFRE